MTGRSKHQKRIIKGYYDNRDALALQKLQEHVTELYLSEGKAREQRWRHVVNALEKLKVPKSRIERIHGQDDVELLAKLVDELLAKK